MGIRNRKLIQLKKDEVRKRKKKEVIQEPAKKVVEEKVVVCDDIEVLTFDKFIKCIISNDYSVLRISGSPNAMHLYLAWIKILSAYYVLD